MTHSSTLETENCKISINFPKSTEDHRLQLFEIHGSVFAIVFGSLQSQGPINLQCEKWNLILLAPIQSTSNIKIAAENIIILSEIDSKEGSVDIHANGYIVTYCLSTNKEWTTVARKGLFNFSDDPGALLFFYRLFEDAVLSIRNNAPESITQAQNSIITALCTLADKISDKKEDTTVFSAMKAWGLQIGSYSPS